MRPGKGGSRGHEQGQCVAVISSLYQELHVGTKDGHKLAQAARR